MSGLPVVATAVGGVPEEVVEGETGLLVPPGDPQALARALSQLLNDEGLRRRAGAAGQRRALEYFTEARMVRQTAEVYEHVLSGTI
jgi:glycosyltransferase involved in cell wall biosynthesis